MRSMLIGATLAVVGMSAATARAQSVVWGGGAQYDIGAAAFAPSVAMTVNDYTGSYSQTEVHEVDSQFKGMPATLYDMCGAYPNFNGPVSYTTGGNYPAIASDGTLGLLFEVHQRGTASNSVLWYAMGLQSGNPALGFLASTGQVGFFPTVSIMRSSLYIVEAHQAQQTQGPLVMNVTSQGADGHWTTTNPWVPLTYNWGAKPSISVWPVNPGGGVDMFIVEVHQGGDTNNLLWSDFGVIHVNSDETWNVSWSATSQYTGGRAPSVAICNNHDVVAVNEGGNGSLWSHTGIITTDSQGNHSFHWIPGTDQQYDNGYKPKISCTSPGSGSDVQAQGLEVHEGQDGAGTSWQKAFTVNP
jgi:hypothetical protein